jgi:hypothetical protein
MDERKYVALGCMGIAFTVALGVLTVIAVLARISQP